MPPRKRAAKEVSMGDILGQLAEGIKQQAKTPNIYGYEPHEKQLQFHKSTAKIRLYIGGNRSGKTTGSVAEGIYYLRGDHPHKRVPEPPVYGRTIGVDFLRGVESILKPQYRRWLPPSLLKDGSWDRSYDSASRMLTLTNGSVLEFMSYEQDTDKFAGVPRHFTHYDEEPPKHIYNECKARLIDYNGDAWFSMTPVEGMTWVYEELFENATPDPDGYIYVVIADMTDNPHISREGIANFLRDMDEDERKRRESGVFVSMGGLVFKDFKPERHVIPYELPPKSWEWYASLDSGWNNPTCWLWHAVSPDNRVVTFWEEYAGQRTVAEWSAIFHERNKAFGKVPDIVVGDPAIKQTKETTGTSVQMEYAKHEVYVMPGINDVPIGINQMQQYLQINPITGDPYWRIMENCPNLIREMKKLSWATWAGRKAQYENNPMEKIHKKNDHAPDSARYFMTCLPELAPMVDTTQKKIQVVESSLVRYDQVLAQMPPTQWSVHQGSDLYALESD